MQHVSNLSRLGLVRRLAVEPYANSSAKRAYPEGINVHFQLFLARHCRVPCELEIRIPRGHRISRGIGIFWTRSSSRAARPRHPSWVKKATVKSPTEISHLRPIALCNVVYKICAKVLANRLKPVLDHIISPYHSAFVLGRLVTDNTLVANEVAHFLWHKRDGQDAQTALKLEVNKAYDRIEWSYLKSILLQLGFPTQ
ncbi:hypothetical protein ACLB2K_055223 [Fragaria x ananassa]